MKNAQVVGSMPQCVFCREYEARSVKPVAHIMPQIVFTMEHTFGMDYSSGGIVAIAAYYQRSPVQVVTCSCYSVYNNIVEIGEQRETHRVYHTALVFVLQIYWMGEVSRMVAAGGYCGQCGGFWSTV